MTIRRSRRSPFSKRKIRRKLFSVEERNTQRTMQMERLEDRCLLAGPQLIGIQPNDGALLQEGDIRDIAPSDLTFRFDELQRIDVATLGDTTAPLGIQITRSNLDGVFAPAKVETDFDTGHLVDVRFSAVRLGQEQNGIQLTFSKRDQGRAGLPTVGVVGRVINISLNTNPGNETTALDLKNAIEANAEASSLIVMDVIGGDQNTNIAAPNIGYSPLTLGGIPADEANDIVIKPGFIGLGDTPNEVIVRFAETLPDDAYRIDVFGKFANALRNENGEAFNDTTDDGEDNGAKQSLDFELDLGAQVISVVPQPIQRKADGTLQQARNMILVYFNDDDLTPAAAKTKEFYKLIFTNETVQNTDDVVFEPTDVFYNDKTDSALLVFAAPLEQLPRPVAPFNPVGPGSFRLRIGTDEKLPDPPQVTSVAADPGSSFDRATMVDSATFGWDLVAMDAGDTQSVVISQEIVPTDVLDDVYDLDLPGSNDEPGHRDFNVTSQRHVLDGDEDSVAGIQTIQYNFRGDIGTITGEAGDPPQPAFNTITDQTPEKKQLAREILEIISTYTGVQFVETDNQGFTIAEGDTDVVNTSKIIDDYVDAVAPEPDARTGWTDVGLVAMLKDDPKWTYEFGGEWFQLMFEQIGHVLDLQHSFDLPPLTIMGHDLDLQFDNELEPDFPGDADLVHLNHLYRPESKDIDLYQFELTQPGLFTAETIAERQRDFSNPEDLLDTVLTLYQVRVELDPTTGEPLEDGSGNLIPVLDANGNEIRDLIGRNDDYFSEDSFLELDLRRGTYYVAVTASGNDNFDPTIHDSGFGGVSQGEYDLRLNFRPNADAAITDADNPPDPTVPGSAVTPIDGDADGVPGGVYNFWFRAAAPSAGPAAAADPPRVVYVDASLRDTKPAGYVGNGELNSADPAKGPFANLLDALNVDAAGVPLPTPNPNAVRPGDILRIVGNPGDDDDIRTEADNWAYEVGFDELSVSLADGSTLEVPKGVTMMVDAGTIFKLRRARIGVGSSSPGPQKDRSAGAMQVLGAPVFVDALGNTLPLAETGTGVAFEAAVPLPDASGKLPEPADVHFTSYNNEAMGLDTFANPTVPVDGDWGGIVFRADIDNADQTRFSYEEQGIFLNYVNHADIQYGGGSVSVESKSQVVTPIQILDARPTVSFNEIRLSHEAAMSASPDSFRETNFHSPEYQENAFTSDYTRIGPDIHGNRLADNAENALWLRIETPAGDRLQKLTVSGRWDDTDIVHLIKKNLVIQGTPGGPFLELIEPSLERVVVRTKADPDSTLPAGTYNYRLVFIDANGNESRPSNATRNVTTAGPGLQSVELSQLLTVDLEHEDVYVARRLYRSKLDGTYELVAQINQNDTVYVDDGTTLGGDLNQPALDNVTFTPTVVAGAGLAAGTYNYRMVLVNSGTGAESTPSSPSEDVILAPLPLGSSYNVTLGNLVTTDGVTYDQRWLYRSQNGGTEPYQLIAVLNATDVAYTDDGTNTAGFADQLDTIRDFRLRPRFDASLVIDPSVVVKLAGAMVETEIGAQFVAEGRDGNEIIFSSVLDDRYGAGGSFDTGNDGPVVVGTANEPQPGSWGGILAGQTSRLSIDNAVLAYGGGITSFGGSFTAFNVVEIHQAEARVAHSVFEFNASGFGGQAPRDRFGRGFNEAAVIFVRGAQPVIFANTIRNNTDADPNIYLAAISINTNALNHELNVDPGRATGFIDRLGGFRDNQGPLIVDNRLSNNDINGMIVRGETVTTQSVWDDTDIAHVLLDTVYIPDFHTFGGVRLESSPTQSLVVKLLSLDPQGQDSTIPDNAGFWANGRPLEIDDRIGGILQIVGQPKSPVVLTSLYDDTEAAGLRPDGDPQADTNNDGDYRVVPTAQAPSPADWNSVIIDRYAHDRNVKVVVEAEARDENPPGSNATALDAQFLGLLAPHEKSGDDNLRLGFEVQGFLTNPLDRDVFSFEATAGTEVWVDLDRTRHAFDPILELIDGNDTVLARSMDSGDESESPTGFGFTVQLDAAGGGAFTDGDTFTLTNKTAAGGVELIFEFNDGAPGAIAGTSDVEVPFAGGDSWDDVADAIADAINNISVNYPADTDPKAPPRADRADEMGLRARVMAEGRVRIFSERDVRLEETLAGIPVVDTLLYENASVAGTVYKFQKTPPFNGVDYYTTNPRDPGFRLILPGPVGTTNTYHLRVRSNTAPGDLDNVDGGLTSGAYQMQIRLHETDEIPGSSVSYANISYADVGVTVRGQPIHSPLLGEQSETEIIDTSDPTLQVIISDPNDRFQTAQYIGNIQTVDRGTLAVSGELNWHVNPAFTAPDPNVPNNIAGFPVPNIYDIDWYSFDIDSDEMSPQLGDPYWPVTFDIDYADGLARPNAELFVFDSAGNFIFTSRDSNVAEDQPGPLQSGDMDDLTRGSVGAKDPYIGTQELPPGRYYVAVSTDGRIPTEMQQFTSLNAANPLLRLEPLDSTIRIAEEHIDFDGNDFAPATPGNPWSTTVPPVVLDLVDDTSPIPWHLGDTTMFFVVDEGTERARIGTVDPFTGQVGIRPDRFNVIGDDVHDIAIRDDGQMYGFSHGLDANLPAGFGPPADELDGDTGHYLRIDTATGSATDLGFDGIFTYEIDPASGNTKRAHRSNNTDIGYGVHMNAIAFGPVFGNGTSERLLGVGNRGELTARPNLQNGVDIKQNILYQFNPDTGAAFDDTGSAREVGAWTDVIEVGEVLTSPQIVAVDATTINTVNNTVVFNIHDGDTFDIDDGIGITTFEFDFGPQVAQNIDLFNRQTIHDGEFFVLDPDQTVMNDEVIFQFNTGPVIEITAPNGLPGNFRDATIVTITDDLGVTRSFEYDIDDPAALTDPTAARLVYGTGTSQLGLAGVLANQINATAGFNVTASVVGNRVSLANDANVFLSNSTGSVIGIRLAGDQAPAPIIQVLPDPATPTLTRLTEGDQFTIRTNFGTTVHTFVFDDTSVPGVPAGANVVTFDSTSSTPEQVGSAILTTIQAMAGRPLDGIRAGSRVAINAIGVQAGTITTTKTGALAFPPFGNFIGIEESFTADQIGQQVEASVTGTFGGATFTASSFATGPATGTQLYTGRISFQGAETGDFRGVSNPAWVDQATAGGVAIGNNPVQLLAADTANSTPNPTPPPTTIPGVAEKMANAIDTALSPVVTAQATGTRINIVGGRPDVSGTPPLTAAGAGPGGNVTGITMVGNEVYAVSDLGGLYHLRMSLIPSNAPTLTTTYITSSATDLLGKNFQGLTAGPPNVEGGRYANMLFAVEGVDTDGDSTPTNPDFEQARLYAFDLTGELQPVFIDGQTSVELLQEINGTNVPVQDILGIEFSTLDQNLFHQTPNTRYGASATAKDVRMGVPRRTDGLPAGLGDPIWVEERQGSPGHGVNQAPDGTRTGNTGGAASIHFGDGTAIVYAGFGGSGTIIDRQVRTYEYPGGAHGSFVTNEFSLQGYSAQDRPVLYFNYWSAAQDQSGGRDAFDVYIADNDGNWDTLQPSPGAIHNDTTLYQTVNQGTWRQARIPLDDYAGSEHLRLRFDFSTAGDFNIGQDSLHELYTGGTELRAIDGRYLRDGDTYTVDGQVFEFESGFTLVPPSGAALAAIDNNSGNLTFTLEVDDDGDTSTAPLTATFEFDADGTLFNAGNERIAIEPFHTAADVARLTQIAIANSALGAFPTHLNEERLNLEINRFGIGFTNVISNLPSPQFDSFDEGILGRNDTLTNPDSILAYVHEGMPRWSDTVANVADEMNRVMEPAFYEPTLLLPPSTSLADGDTFKLMIDDHDPTTDPAAMGVIFEFDAGYIMQVDTNGGTAFTDGDTFTLSDVPNGGTSTPLVFEFNDGPPGALVNAGAVEIAFLATDSQVIMAQNIVNAINNDPIAQASPLITGQARVLSGGRVQIRAQAPTAVNATPPPALTPPLADLTMNPGPTVGGLSFDLPNPLAPTSIPGITVPNPADPNPGVPGDTPDLPHYVAIEYSPSSNVTASDVALLVRDAINIDAQALVPQLTINATQDANATRRLHLSNFGPAPNGFDTDIVFTDTGTGGDVQLELTIADVNNDVVKQYEDLIRVIGHTVDDQGPLGWDSTLAGDAQGETAGVHSRQRDEANLGEGIYFDDIIIGFAERGEMVTGASGDSSTIPTAVTGRTEGEYQLEIRRSEPYRFVDTYDTNDRQTQGYTIVAQDGSLLTDGETFTLTDGVNSVVFEYEDTVRGDGVAAGHIEVPFDSQMTNWNVARNIRDAVNRSQVRAEIDVLAALSDGREDLLLPDLDNPDTRDLDLRDDLRWDKIGAGPTTTDNRVNLFGTVWVTRDSNRARLPVEDLGDTTPNNDVIAGAVDSGITGFNSPSFLVAGEIGDKPIYPLQPGKDVDLFEVTLNAGEVLRIDVDADEIGSTLDPVLRMFTAAGTPILFNPNTGSNLFGFQDGIDDLAAPGEIDTSDPYMEFTAPANGTYYVGVSGASNWSYDPNSPPTSEDDTTAREGSVGFYHLDMTFGVATETDLLLFNELGDQNLFRDQGQIYIHSNRIRNSRDTGILVDAGLRDTAEGNSPHVGPPRNLDKINVDLLAPGVTVENNVVSGSGQVGIRVNGSDQNAGNPVGAIPFGRVVNNTVFGVPARGNQLQSLIDFETLPGSTPVEGLAISDQFLATHGVSFAYEDNTLPILAEVGAPEIAFDPNDTVSAAFASEVGRFFLTDGSGDVAGPTSALLVQYSPPTAAASGIILDIDDRPGGTFEQWTIEALDAGGAVLQTVVLTAGDPGTGDTEATRWSIDVGAATIATIRFTPTGTAPLDTYGFALDNFFARDTLAAGTGIMVGPNASPTLLNNILAGLDEGINVDPTSRSTVIGGSLYQDNTQNRVGFTAADEDFEIELLPGEALFQNSTAGNFYLQAGSKAIDNSVPSLEERFAYQFVKDPLGIAPSPIIAPELDVTGQLRVGNSVKVDRGALDRSDFAGPRAVAITPRDNDADGVDTNPEERIIEIDGGNVLSRFEIRLVDGVLPADADQGIGIDDLTVTTEAVTIFKDGVRLVEGLDYSFSYVTTNDTVTITPLSGIWPQDSIYTILLNNKDHFRISFPDGNLLPDGTSFQVVDSQGSLARFEFESGYRMQVPQTLAIQVPAAGGALGGVEDRQVFELSNGVITRRFEFNRTSLANGVDPNAIEIPFDVNDGADKIAQTIADVIRAQAPELGLSPRGPNDAPNHGLGMGVVHLGALNTHTVNTSLAPTLTRLGTPGVAIEDGDLFTIDDGSKFVTFEFENTVIGDGVAAGNVAINFRPFDTHQEIAQTIIAAIVSQELGLTPLDLGDGHIYVGGEQRHVLDTIVSPTNSTMLRQSGAPGVENQDFGLQLPIRAGAIFGLMDTESFTIRDGVNAPVTFEFDNTDVSPGLANVANVRIAFNNASSVADVAAAIRNAILGAGVGLNPVYIGDGILNLEGSTIRHSIDLTNTTVAQRGNPGKEGAVPIYITPLATFDDIQVAVAAIDAMNNGPLAIQASPGGGPVVIVEGAASIGELIPPSDPNFVPPSYVPLFVTREFLGAIKDLAGNPLKPNLLSGETQMTIVLGNANLDFGDAPQTSVDYPTELGHNGPVHVITADPLFLGGRIDAEPDGQVSADATGDDKDSDGFAIDVTNAGGHVSIIPPATATTPTTITVDLAVADGDYFSITTPVDTYNFEFEDTNLDDGTAAGHIPVRFDPAMTLTEKTQAVIDSILDARLGIAVTDLGGGQVELNGDDEDGVLIWGVSGGIQGVFRPDPDTPTKIDVTASAAGLLDAWVDFNIDGDLNDDGEQIFASQQLSAGTNEFLVVTPTNAQLGETLARFRFSSMGGLKPTGLAADGEVEDYWVKIESGLAPTANDDSYLTDEDTPNKILNVLVNAFPVGPDAVGDGGGPLEILTFQTVSEEGAIVSRDPANLLTQLVYDPTSVAAIDGLGLGDILVDTFTYRVFDGKFTSPEATVTVTIAGKNDIPIALDDTSIFTTQDDAIDINVLANDRDPEDGSVGLVVNSVTPNTDGDGSAAGVFIHHRTQKVELATAGAVTLSYKGSSGTTPLTYTPGVSPTAADVQAHLESIEVAAVKVLEGKVTVTGSDGGPFTVDIQGGAEDVPLLGSSDTAATISPLAIRVHFDPLTAFRDLDAGQTRDEQFTYTIRDADGGISAPATVTVTVSGLDDLPEAMDDIDDGTYPDYLTTDEDHDFQFPIAGAAGAAIMGNDSDPEGGALTLANVDTRLTKGLLAVDTAGNKITYNPNGEYETLAQGAVGTDTFAYKIADPNANLSVPATVTITITGVNDPPVATSFTGPRVARNATVSFDVLSHVFDIDQGDTLQVIDTKDIVGTTVSTEDPNLDPNYVAADDDGHGVTPGSTSEVTYDPNGKFDWLPIGAEATDEFTFVVQDANGLQTEATVTVTVFGASDPPEAKDDGVAPFPVITTTEDASVSINVLANDINHSPNPLSVMEIGAGPPTPTGRVTIEPAAGAANNTVLYSPDGRFDNLKEGEQDTDSFTYRVSDGTHSDWATVTVTIEGVNDAPIANLDPNGYTVVRGSTLNTNDGVDDPGPQDDSVLLNDTDAEGDALTAVLITPPQHAAANGFTLFDNGFFTYTHNGNSAPNDTFQYVARDEHGALSQQVVTVVITITEPPPAQWQNPINRFDVNNDGFVSPVDVLLVINYINNNSPNTDPPAPPATPPPYLDTNGNNEVTSLDVLGIITYLNAQNQNAEGERAAGAEGEAAPIPALIAAPLVDIGSSAAGGSEAVVAAEPPLALTDQPDDHARDQRTSGLARRESLRNRAEDEETVHVDPFGVEDALSAIAEEVNGSLAARSPLDEVLNELLV